MLKTLTLESLAEIDNGKASLAFARHLQRAAEDCYDRPSDGKARVITLKVEVKPVTDDKGLCEEGKVQIKAASTVPSHQTKVYSFGLKPNGQLLYNPDALDCVRQSTMLPDEE